MAALLMYGSGLRLMECLTLRVKDLDFSAGEITVRGGKENKDRRTMLPAKEWGWQWVFPATRFHRTRAGLVRRHHLHETVM